MLADLSMLAQKIGLIGAGRMATALARGFLQAKLVAPGSLVVSDAESTARNRFASEFPGASIAEENKKVAALADVLILAVKPQQMSAALEDLAGALRSQTLVVSIAAGVSLARLAEKLPKQTRLVRVMPNSPCLVGQGASGYALGQYATPDDGKMVHELLTAVGQAFEVPETMLDAVTGLSGSGPAFVYSVIESMIEGGTAMGLPPELARNLAAQTVAGAAIMVQSTGQEPAALRDQVTSPGGTTLAGLEVLERGGFGKTLVEAIRAATKRSEELGKTS
jgi:pyrroline-5-carboxylate reductase